MSKSEPDRNDDPLDPVRIREDLLPATQAVEDGRLRSASLLNRGLVASLLLLLIGLLTPIFLPLDERPTEIAFINSDEVVIYTDPPGATIKTDSLSANGSPLGTSSADPIVIDQIFGQEKTNATLLIEMDGYNTVRQLLTSMDTGNKIWPQTHQPPLRLSTQNPLVYLFDYLPRYRPLLFACLCLGATAAGILTLALRQRAKWLSRRETIRQQEKKQDNLTGLSVLGYEVVERRGAGATSLIYRSVSEKDFQTERALRFSRLAGVTDKDGDSFRREAGLYGKMDHPNVVKAYDFQRYENTFVTVMELIDGSNLENAFGPGRPLPVERALPIFSGIAAGLDYCHSKGVIHRDLKPANVMLRQDGSPVLVDFGMATDLNVAKITQTGVIKGTLAYIAPEQITGVSTVGPPADQFAFGLMLYEALSGKFANDTEDPARLFTDRLHGNVIPFSQAAPNLPEAVGDAIMKMIALKADQRFANVSEAMEQVRQGLEREASVHSLARECKS